MHSYIQVGIQGLVGRGHDLQSILEDIKIGSVDSSGWKFVPFCDSLRFRNNICSILCYILNVC